MSTDFSPLDSIERALRGWWLIVALAMLGGLAGWLVSRAHPPLYEARIGFTFTIDFATTGPLTDIEEDQALEAVGDILNSSDVIAATVKDAAAQGIPVDARALSAMSSRERTASTWLIRLRSPDPATGAALANLWGARAAAALGEASQHAVAVGALQRSLDALEGCLGSSVASEPVQAYCNPNNLADIQARIDQDAAALHRETLDSQGMMPGLGFSWTEKAAPAAHPVAQSRGRLILAGGLIGIVLAGFAVQSGLADRLVRKPHHA